MLAPQTFGCMTKPLLVYLVTCFAGSSYAKRQNTFSFLQMCVQQWVPGDLVRDQDITQLC